MIILGYANILKNNQNTLIITSTVPYGAKKVFAMLFYCIKCIFT
jgi:hypothetical protein